MGVEAKSASVYYGTYIQDRITLSAFPTRRCFRVMFSFKTKANLEITITVSIGNTCIVSILLRYIKYYYTVTRIYVTIYYSKHWNIFDSFLFLCSKFVSIQTLIWITITYILHKITSQCCSKTLPKEQKHSNYWTLI